MDDPRSPIVIGKGWNIYALFCFYTFAEIQVWKPSDFTALLIMQVLYKLIIKNIDIAINQASALKAVYNLIPESGMAQRW